MLDSDCFPVVSAVHEIVDADFISPRVAEAALAALEVALTHFEQLIPCIYDDGMRSGCER